MLTHINMIAIPETRAAANESVVVLGRRVVAPPAFEVEESAEKRVFSEVVAVAYRDAKGKPVHGGLFGFSAEGVASLALVDEAAQVDTNYDDPSGIWRSLVMMQGPLVFRQAGVDQKMDLSIVDLHADRPDEKLHSPTPGREAVKAAYLADVLPAAHRS